MYGTDITRALRKAGFNGLIYICSANDECSSVKHYLAAGATGSLLKTSVFKLSDLVEDIIKQCAIGFRASTPAEMEPPELSIDIEETIADLKQSAATSLPLTVPNNMRDMTRVFDTHDGSTLVDELHSAGDRISS